MPRLSAFETKSSLNIQDIAVPAQEKLRDISLESVVTPEILMTLNEMIEKNKSDIEFYLDARSAIVLLCQATGFRANFFTQPFNVISKYLDSLCAGVTPDYDMLLESLAAVHQIYGNQATISTSILKEVREYRNMIVEKFSSQGGNWTAYEVETLINIFTMFPYLYTSFRLVPNDAYRLLELANATAGIDRAQHLAQLRLLDPTYTVSPVDRATQLRVLKSEKQLKDKPHWYTNAMVDLAILFSQTVGFMENGIQLTPAAVSARVRQKEQENSAPPTQRSF